MEFTFLGTSSGVPTRQRNVSGLALRGPREKSWYLIDCGEGTQHQLLRTRYSLQRLHAIFITHVHGDHCFGLPGLLASAGMAGRKEALTIIGPEALAQFVLLALEITHSHLPYPLKFLAVEELEHWRGPDVLVRKWELSHRVPSYAYSFQEDAVERKLDKDRLLQEGIPSGPSWGALLRGEAAYGPRGEVLERERYLLPPRKPRKIVVGGDNDEPGLLAEACEDADLLIHESTYAEAAFKRVGAGRQHSYAASVAAFAEGAGLPNLILTHFSSRYQHGRQHGDNAIELLAEEARQHYRGNLHLAEDFGSYSLEKDGSLAPIPEGDK